MRNRVCEKDYIWNPTTCSCKYVASIIDDSAITCDEIVKDTKTVPTNFNEKNAACNIFFFHKNFYNIRKTFKNNNNNSNYINQLLKLPFLKQTHTKKMIILNKTQYQPPSPRNKHPYGTPDGGTPEAVGILDPLYSYVSAT